MKTSMLAVVLVVLACGGDEPASEPQAEPENSTGSVETPPEEAEPGDLESDATWAGICERYAEQCSDDDDLERCRTNCTASGYQNDKEVCAFMLCGVETGMCDNQEDGDATILACARERGLLN